MVFATSLVSSLSGVKPTFRTLSLLRQSGQRHLWTYLIAISSTMSPLSQAWGPSAPTYIPSPFLSSIKFMKNLDCQFSSNEELDDALQGDKDRSIAGIELGQNPCRFGQPLFVALRDS